MEELNTLSTRNDELMSEREQDAQGMNDMEAKVDDYRKKFDAVRIELRNLKGLSNQLPRAKGSIAATSVIFTSRPLTDDHLPASMDGNITDVHVSAFQTAIDGLLAAARSSTPTGVLPAMKAIVESVSEIGQDVEAFEIHPNLNVDATRLEHLKHESTSRLNALMQAARNHAMASGLSPVSLLDAAAGHLSANVVEIIKLLKIRRSNQELSRSRSSLSIKDMVNRNARSGTPDIARANGSFDRDYGRHSNGSQEHLREPAVTLRQPSDDRYRPDRLEHLDRSPSTTPDAFIGKLNGRAPASFRINSFQSASSQARSDSFDLERNTSVASASASDRRMLVDRDPPLRKGSRDAYEAVPRSGSQNGISSLLRDEAPSRSSNREADRFDTLRPTRDGQPRDRGLSAHERDSFERDSAKSRKNPAEEEQEWESLKPYLNNQSSLLVNSIQNLLAAIRTGGHTSALNEHLSEVIAIASSIVAVGGTALPTALRHEGDVLLKDLVSLSFSITSRVSCARTDGQVNFTDKLSEAQEAATREGGGGFEKNVRQQIASASFGVAKSLKALMKLGTE